MGVAGPVVRVAVRSLLPSDSPRIGGEDRAHLLAMAESGAELPPIIVQRSSMRVIDGMHRLRTAELRGEHEIGVRFFDGDDVEAFVLAVKANVTHGLPLTLADRKAAATRILRFRPEWSDRVIADISGLSPKTVGAIRARSTGEIPQVNSRVGRDGRVRPVDSADRRRVASEVIARHPTATLREVAAAAGISVATARDVRLQMHRDPQPAAPATDPAMVMRRLQTDPSLRFTENGRALLRVLSVNALIAPRWDRLADDVPSHCADEIARLAGMYAAAWAQFDQQLRQRSNSTESESEAV